MANGILIVDKPQGWTSHDVVAKLRGILREKRIGHAGTLDPMATGVLPVFVGRATRAVEFAADQEKEYRAVLRLGVVTDTQDITGTVLETHPASITTAQLEGVLPAFRGAIQQIPPMYSAIKKDGQKLYVLARKGQEVARAPRPVTIHQLELEGSPAPGEFILRVLCSKGTYIRTLCHDIGQALGCGGTLAYLRRTRSAGFSLEDARTLEEIQAAPDPTALLLPVDAYFSGVPIFLADPAVEKKIRNGNAFPCPAPEGTYRVYTRQQEFLMLGRVTQGRMQTIKSFFEV